MKRIIRSIPFITILLSLHTMPLYANADYSDAASHTNNEVHSAALSMYFPFGLFEIVFIFLMLSVVIKVTVSITKKAAKKNEDHYQAHEQLRRPDKYRNIDPSFSEEEFRKLLSEMFMRLQEGCNAKDITEMRRYMTNELYSDTLEQLSHYESLHQTDHTECINLLDVQLKGWKKSETHITMIAAVNANMIHYITDDNTGEVISGSNTEPITLRYEMSVIRHIGIRSNGRSIYSCPNCKAHIEINYSGVCKYCGTHIMSQNTGWTLSTIIVPSQPTQR